MDLLEQDENEKDKGNDDENENDEDEDKDNSRPEFPCVTSLVTEVKWSSFIEQVLCCVDETGAPDYAVTFPKRKYTPWHGAFRSVYDGVAKDFKEPFVRTRYHTFRKMIMDLWIQLATGQQRPWLAKQDPLMNPCRELAMKQLLRYRKASLILAKSKILKYTKPNQHGCGSKSKLEPNPVNLHRLIQPKYAPITATQKHRVREDDFTGKVTSSLATRDSYLQQPLPAKVTLPYPSTNQNGPYPHGQDLSHGLPAHWLPARLSGNRESIMPQEPALIAASQLQSLPTETTATLPLPVINHNGQYPYHGIQNTSLDQDPDYAKVLSLLSQQKRPPKDLLDSIGPAEPQVYLQKQQQQQQQQSSSVSAFIRQTLKTVNTTTKSADPPKGFLELLDLTARASSAAAAAAAAAELQGLLQRQQRLFQQQQTSSGSDFIPETTKTATKQKDPSKGLWELLDSIGPAKLQDHHLHETAKKSLQETEQTTAESPTQKPFFPRQLYDLLGYAHVNDKEHIIRWTGARSFAINDEFLFVQKLMRNPEHFSDNSDHHHHHNTMEDFEHTLREWGFRKITGDPLYNMFVHRHFRKGNPTFLENMQRVEMERKATTTIPPLPQETRKRPFSKQKPTYVFTTETTKVAKVLAQKVANDLPPEVISSTPTVPPSGDRRPTTDDYDSDWSDSTLVF